MNNGDKRFVYILRSQAAADRHYVGLTSDSTRHLAPSARQYMSDKTSWESFKAEGSNLVDKLAELIREGNVRRVIVEHQGKTIAEFPLTIGVIGIAVAPIAAAIGGLVALLKDCTIKIERES